jgi:hypothetical protein
MGGKITKDSEIVDRAYKSFAKLPAPNSINKDPGGERIFGTCNPVGKL